MSTLKPSPIKLEDNPLWAEGNELAEHMYEKLPEFPEDQKWGLRTKLQMATTDFIFWLALALGNAGPSGTEFDWASARKHAGALKTIYRLAGRQKFIELDPAVMVRLDKLRDKIDAETAKAFEQSERFRKESAERDLKPWLEKYEIWKKLNKDGEKR